MNPLDSIPGTIGAGFVLTVVLYFVVNCLSSFLRTFH